MVGLTIGFIPESTTVTEGDPAQLSVRVLNGNIDSDIDVPILFTTQNGSAQGQNTLPDVLKYTSSVKQSNWCSYVFLLCG